MRGVNSAISYIVRNNNADGDRQTPQSVFSSSAVPGYWHQFSILTNRHDPLRNDKEEKKFRAEVYRLQVY